MLWICLIIFVFVIIEIFCVIIPFYDERKYVKTEMNRSFSRHEYLKWEKRLRILWLSLIPGFSFFYRLYRKHKKKNNE